MIRKISPYALGATLYMPALHPDIGEVIAGRKIGGVSSIVLCLEDALGENDVEAGLNNLRTVLDVMAEEPREPGQRPLVFVRPRNLAMAGVMGDWKGIDLVDGFVAPKVRPGNVAAWMESLAGTDLLLMPTLETAEMLDPVAVREFRDELLANQPERVLALRIGGNDLMSCMGLRRTRGATLYEGPMLYAISMLVSLLAPAGFSLTSPVCEIIDDVDLLARELEGDLRFGLVGKTAIHPSQVDPIQAAFRVTPRDHAVATRILAEDAPAVFKQDGVMQEPATHLAWARKTMERAAEYGIAGPWEPEPDTPDVLAEPIRVHGITVPPGTRLDEVRETVAEAARDTVAGPLSGWRRQLYLAARNLALRGG